MNLDQAIIVNQLSAGGPGSGRHKVVFTVDSKPTGKYWAFQKRGFPMGHYGNGEPAVQLLHEQTYTPLLAKQSGLNLKVSVADHSAKNDLGLGFRWRTLVKRADTLDEAKQLAQRFIDNNPNFRPDGYK